MKQPDMTKLSEQDLKDHRALVAKIHREVGAIQLKGQLQTPKPRSDASNAAPASFSTVLGDVPAEYVFIDDKCNPGDIAGLDGFPDNKAWKLIGSYEDFEAYLKKHGVPKFISFDFNLEQEKTGHDCAKLLIQYCLEHDIDKLPDTMSHSNLQTHRQAIEGLIGGWGRKKRLYKEKLGKK